MRHLIFALDRLRDSTDGTTTFDFTDEQGALLFEVRRLGRAVGGRAV